MRGNKNTERPAGPTKPAAAGRSTLGRHLAVALIVKFFILALLWHSFIKPYRIKVDVPTMADHMTGTPAIQKEKHHD